MSCRIRQDIFYCLFQNSVLLYSHNFDARQAFFICVISERKFIYGNS